MDGATRPRTWFASLKSTWARRKMGVTARNVVRTEWLRIVIMADDDNFSLDTDLDNVGLCLFLP